MRGAGLQLAEAAGKTWQDLRQSCPQSTEAKCALGFRFSFDEELSWKTMPRKADMQTIQFNRFVARNMNIFYHFLSGAM